jgi:hypothetical protein
MASPPDGAVLRPYLAPLLVRRVGGTAARAFLRGLRTEVEAQVSSSSVVTRTVLDLSSVQRAGELQVQTLQYVEESAPPGRHPVR